MSDKLNLDEIEARAKAAAELADDASTGPWVIHVDQWQPNDKGRAEIPGIKPTLRRIIKTEWVHPQLKAQASIIHECSSPYFEHPWWTDMRTYDAAFIAAARTDVPALAADVQALLAEVRRLRGELAAAEYMDAEGDAWGPGIMAQE